jgi:1-deoxy-D-xylulose-5-phosphate synthase
MVKTALDCAALLRKDSLDTFLVNARFIKPLDEELLRYIAENFKFVITLEEGSLTCGFGSSVMEFYEKEDMLDKIKLVRAGFPDEFVPAAKREELFQMYGLDATTLARRIKKFIKEEVLWQK